MATDQEIPTPDPQAADLPNPVEGTASSDGGGNGATNEAPPNYEERFKQSSREFQRLQQETRAREQAWLAEQARYNAEIAALRVQQRPAPAADPVHEGSYWTPDEAKAFSNAVIDQDAAK